MRDFYQALQIAEQLKMGIVHINDQTVGDEPWAPFGGLRGSGWCRRLGGKAALEEFTELRSISVQREPRHFRFRAKKRTLARRLYRYRQVNLMFAHL